MGVIYKLTSPSGKSYIGQTVRPFEERWGNHISSAKLGGKDKCALLNKAIRKHGSDNFKKEILYECNEELLNDLEMEMIWLHGTLAPNGYNLRLGGGGSGYSDISKLKMSESQKVLHATDERTRLRNQLIGYNHKKNKSLPMYMCEEFDKSKEFIGYRIRAHPNYPHTKKFCNKKNPEEAYDRATEFLKYLDSLNEPISHSNLVTGNPKSNATKDLPKYIVHAKSSSTKLIIGYTVQTHQYPPVRFTTAPTMEENLQNAILHLSTLDISEKKSTKPKETTRREVLTAEELIRRNNDYEEAQAKGVQERTTNGLQARKNGIPKYIIAINHRISKEIIGYAVQTKQHPYKQFASTLNSLEDNLQMAKDYLTTLNI